MTSKIITKPILDVEGHLDVVKALVNISNKTVIWSNKIKETVYLIKAIREILGDNSVVHFGAYNTKEVNQKSLDDFNNDDRVKVFITSTKQATGYRLTDKVDTMIFYNHNIEVDRHTNEIKQALGRIHNPTYGSKVRYVFLSQK